MTMSTYTEPKEFYLAWSCLIFSAGTVLSLIFENSTNLMMHALEV